MLIIYFVIGLTNIITIQGKTEIKNQQSLFDVTIKNIEENTAINDLGRGKRYAPYNSLINKNNNTIINNHNIPGYNRNYNSTKTGYNGPNINFGSQNIAYNNVYGNNTGSNNNARINGYPFISGYHRQNNLSNPGQNIYSYNLSRAGYNLRSVFGINNTRPGYNNNTNYASTSYPAGYNARPNNTGFNRFPSGYTTYPGINTGYNTQNNTRPVFNIPRKPGYIPKPGSNTTVPNYNNIRYLPANNTLLNCNRCINSTVIKNNNATLIRSGSVIMKKDVSKDNCVISCNGCPVGMKRVGGICVPENYDSDNDY